MRFEKKENCYLDNETGLEWSLENFSPMPWHEDMKKFDGSDGWRVPTIEELLTLVNYEKYDPATKLPNMLSSYYWSSTIDASVTNYAWIVHFRSGTSYRDVRSNSRYVRAVGVEPAAKIGKHRFYVL